MRTGRRVDREQLAEPSTDAGRTRSAPEVPTMRVGLTTTVLMWFAAACPATAQTPEDSPQIREPRRIFDQAMNDHEQLRYASAAREFEQVYDMMDGHPRQFMVLFNLGQCLADAGEYDEAIRRLRQYLAQGGDRVENRGQVEQRIAEID